MYLNFIYLTTAIFGYIAIFIIGFNFKSNRQTNVFLILFFFFSSTRFLFNGMPNIPFREHMLFVINVAFTITSWPLLYMYFKHLIKKRNKLSFNESLHFLVPIIVIIFATVKFAWSNLALEILYPMIGIINCVINLYYYCLSYKIISKHIWQRNSKIKLIDNQNKTIRKWSTYLFIVFSIIFFRVLINFLIIDKAILTSNKNDYLWVSALIWIVLYIKILTDPEFLYGYDVLQTKIKEYKKRTIILDNIWKTELAKTGLNIKDGILKDKIQTSVKNYIIEIEHIALHSSLFFKESFSAADLAMKLCIPKSHLLFVFKYHSKVSFSDFKKIIRIQKAIFFMEEDYLKNNTMESLAIDLGFSSYSPFFKSFKTITGFSPHEYYNKKDLNLR